MSIFYEIEFAKYILPYHYLRSVVSPRTKNSDEENEEVRIPARLVNP